MIGRQMNIYTRKPIYFTVTWKCNNNVLKTEQVEIGDSATPPEVSVEGYDLLHWDKSYSKIMSNIVINAVMQIKSYTVKFYYNGTLLKTEIVQYLNSATAPNMTEQQGYELTWDVDFSSVKSDLNINASFKRYTILMFKNPIGWDILTRKAYVGESVTPPDPTLNEREYLSQYDFVEWSSDIYKNIPDNPDIEYHIYAIYNIPFDISCYGHVGNGTYFTYDINNDNNGVWDVYSESYESKLYAITFCRLIDINNSPRYKINYISESNIIINNDSIANITIMCDGTIVFDVLKDGDITLTINIGGMTDTVTIRCHKCYSKFRTNSIVKPVDVYNIETINCSWLYHQERASVVNMQECNLSLLDMNNNDIIIPDRYDSFEFPLDRFYGYLDGISENTVKNNSTIQQQYSNITNPIISGWAITPGICKYRLINRDILSGLTGYTWNPYILYDFSKSRDIDIHVTQNPRFRVLYNNTELHSIELNLGQTISLVCELTTKNISHGSTDIVYRTDVAPWVGYYTTYNNTTDNIIIKVREHVDSNFNKIQSSDNIICDITKTENSIQLTAIRKGFVIINLSSDIYDSSDNDDLLYQGCNIIIKVN